MPTQNRYLRTLRFVRAFLPGMLVALGFSTAGTLAVTLQPWPIKLLIDGVLTNQRLDLGPLGAINTDATADRALVAAALAGTYLALAIASAAVHGAAVYYSVRTGQEMVLSLRLRLARSLRARSDGRGGLSVGDTIWRGVNDAGSAARFAQLPLRPTAQAVFGVALMAVFMLAIDPLLAAATLITVPLLAMALRTLAAPIRQAAVEAREQHARLTSFFEQTTRALEVVRIFGRDQDEERRAMAASRTAADATVRQSVRDRWLLAATMSITGLGTAIVVLVGAQRVLSGAITVGSLWVFLIYMRILNETVNQTVLSYGPLQDSIVGLTRVFDVVERTERAPSTAANAARPVASMTLREGIRFRDVSFRYGEDGEATLSGLNLEVRAGETIALVGPTGAGKTTLLRLFAGLAAPSSGVIEFDGIDIASIATAELQSAISIVPQQPLLLSGSVRDNVVYGRPEASDRDARLALDLASATFVYDLPGGLDAEIGDSGASLSGGEQQRVAIARALAKDAPVLLLDEPTSALDLKTENELLDRLGPALAERTVIIAAHRLSLLRLADRIFVMYAGRIVEAGTHDELMVLGGRYYGLFRRDLGLPNREKASGASLGAGLT